MIFTKYQRFFVLDVNIILIKFIIIINDNVELERFSI